MSVAQQMMSVAQRVMPIQPPQLFMTSIQIIPSLFLMEIGIEVNIKESSTFDIVDSI
jgi:hypothetical protein